MKQDYETLYLANFIEKSVALIGKPTVFMRSYGWNNSTNIDKINESMDVYRSMLPEDMFNALHESEFVFLVLEDLEEAIQFFEDTFPKDQASCEKEYYIHFSIMNELGQTIYSN